MNLDKPDVLFARPLYSYSLDEVAGFCEAHKRFGTLPFEQVLEPAIALASKGFEANWYLTMSAANMHDTFDSDPQLSSVWLPGGKVPKSHPKPGTRIIQKDLAHLLQNLDLLYQLQVELQKY